MNEEYAGLVTVTKPENIWTGPYEFHIPSVGFTCQIESMGELYQLIAKIRVVLRKWSSFEGSLLKFGDAEYKVLEPQDRPTIEMLHDAFVDAALREEREVSNLSGYIARVYNDDIGFLHVDIWQLGDTMSLPVIVAVKSWAFKETRPDGSGELVWKPAATSGYSISGNRSDIGLTRMLLHAVELVMMVLDNELSGKVDKKYVPAELIDKIRKMLESLGLEIDQ